MLFMTGVTLLVAECRSAKIEKKWRNPAKKADLNGLFDERVITAGTKPMKALCCCGKVSGFEDVDLNKIPGDKRAAYRANNARNVTGYLMMPVAGAVLLVVRIVLRAVAKYNEDLRDSESLSWSPF